MTIVCAYQFEMQPRAGQTSRQCFAAVRDEVTGWVRRFYHRKGRNRLRFPHDGTRVAPRAGHEVWADQQECATHRLATLDWQIPRPPDPARAWRFSCVLACDAQGVQVALLIQSVQRTFCLRPQHGRLGKGSPFASFGELLGRLVYDWPCRIEGRPVPTAPHLLGTDQVEPFVHETLLDPGRVLPVVMLAPGDKAFDGLSEETAMEILAALQGQLLGLAHVAALRDRPAAARLTELLGPERSCEGEGMRLYWPGFTKDAPPAAHVFRTAEQLRQEFGGDSLVHDLGSAVAGDLYVTLANMNGWEFQEGRVICAARAALAAERRAAAVTAERLAETQAELQQARQARERFRQERDAAEQQLRTLQSELADVRGQLAAFRDAASSGPAGRDEGFDEFAAELERTWDENERLRAERDAAQQRAAELEADLRNTKENLAQLWESPAAPGTQPPVPGLAGERAFDTVADALRAAVAEFADVLTLWEDATRSAEQSLFASPAKVFQALQAIAAVGRDYFQAQSGGPPLGPVDQAFRTRVPFKYTGFESQTTLSLYGAERVFHHGEQSRQMQRHLTLGGGQTSNCLQIYFEFDDATRRVLIGYCGRHLSYYRQRT